jgi:TonB-linked SusC/RagA family outer membrane protein
MKTNFTRKVHRSPNKWGLFYTLLLGFMCLNLFSYAQDPAVIGKVTSIEGEGLPGVNIMIEGTTTGAITDIDGNYNMSIPDGSSLIFSYVGYKTQEILVGNQSVIDIALEADISSLEEVIVVGYGTVKKKDLTGAVGQIDAAQIAHQSPNSVTDVLRANVPGLNVGFNNSPKGVSQMEIRGKTTLNAGAQPLIVLDGTIFNGDLSDINPQDIDKVDVMKDASSAAIYGSRGSNGVILITTKRGTSEKPTINLSMMFGVATKAFDNPPYDPQGYANWRTDVFKSINYGVDDQPGYFDRPDNLPPGVSLEDWLAYDGASGDPTTAWLNRVGFQDVEIGNYLADQSIDWYDRVFQNGPRSDLNLSLSGQKSGLRYYWSIGHTSNEGIIVGDKFETIRTRLNLDAKVTDWLNVGVNTQFAVRDEGSVPAEWWMYQRDSPWGSELSDDETTLRFSPQDDSGAGARHPFLRRTYTERDREYNTLNARMYAQIALPWGFSYEFAFTNRYEWNHYYNHQSSVSPEWATGTAFRENRKIQEWQIENIFKWDKTFGDHTINATFLAYAEKYQDYLARSTNSLFSPNDKLGYNNLSLGTAPVLSGNDQTATGDALMARANYSFKSKYLFSASVRRDGYSAFGPENKRATFPSVSGGWVISDESFWGLGSIDFMKIRASWGENGNRNIGRYAYLSRLTSNKNLIIDNGSITPVATLDPATMENAELKWERTKAFNIGLDFSIKEGVVEGSLDVYNMITNDLLVDRALPDVTGYTNVLSNLGEIQNSGFELALKTRNITNPNFAWSSMFNFSVNRNKINSLYGDLDEEGNELDDFTNEWFIGHDIDELYGQRVLGIWQVNQAEEADRYGVVPGDFQILDKNDDGVFTQDDNEFLGYAKPRYRWTFVNNFNFWKNFDLSIEIYSMWGMKRTFNEAKNRSGFIDRTNSITTPYWTEANPSNEWARLFSSQGSASYNVYRANSFIRLQNVTLSYTLPQEVVNKIKLQNLRVYGNIRNAAVWAPDWEIWDPEATEIDGVSGTGPTPRYFTLGLNLTL